MVLDLEWTLNPMTGVLIRGEKGEPEVRQRGEGQVRMKTEAGEIEPRTLRNTGSPRELMEAGRTLISGRGNKRHHLKLSGMSPLAAAGRELSNACL